MANPTGILSGSKVLLKAVISGQQVVIGGLTTNSSTYATEVIDITNKSASEHRSLLTGEGHQTLDHSCECLFSSDTAYQTIRTRYFAKSVDEYIVDYGDRSEKYKFQISNMADTLENNSAASTSITLTSSGDIMALENDFNFLTSTGDNFLTSDGEQFVVKG